MSTRMTWEEIWKTWVSEAGRIAHNVEHAKPFSLPTVRGRTLGSLAPTLAYFTSLMIICLLLGERMC